MMIIHWIRFVAHITQPRTKLRLHRRRQSLILLASFWLKNHPMEQTNSSEVSSQTHLPWEPAFQLLYTSPHTSDDPPKSEPSWGVPHPYYQLGRAQWSNILYRFEGWVIPLKWCEPLAVLYLWESWFAWINSAKSAPPKEYNLASSGGPILSTEQLMHCSTPCNRCYSTRTYGGWWINESHHFATAVLDVRSDGLHFAFLRLHLNDIHDDDYTNN